MGFKMKPKSPLTKKLVGGQHRLPEGLKAEILASPAKDYSVERGSHNHPHSPAKHKPWSSEHKENAAHPNTAEAHNASPAKNYKNPQDYKVFNMGNEPTPVKKYKSDAQRKAVHASKADGGKGAPTKKKEQKVTVMKRKPVKRLPVSKGAQQAEKDKIAYDKGELYTYGGRPKSYTAAEDKEQLEREQKPIRATASPNKKRGLWDNIHAKRKRGEKMRKKGAKGAPTEKAIKESQSPAKSHKPGHGGPYPPKRKPVPRKPMPKPKPMPAKPQTKPTMPKPKPKPTRPTGRAKLAIELSRKKKNLADYKKLKNK